VHLDLKAPSWKVDELLELLEERPGEPVVAFGESRQLMVLAAEAARRKGRRVGMVVGGQTQKARTETVDAFQAGDLDLICATTGAGGVGITLTAARTVVFLQRPWSIVDSIQAEDRCHRIGSEQHDSIEVIDIVARNTLDTRVRAVLRDRAEQLADLVQDPRIVAGLLGGTTTDTETNERKAS
jgi:SNF2 family DNA or RNA helicase